jgi:hypothetical protein
VSSGPVYVTANPRDMFRILFYLIHNAVGVARTAGTPRRIFKPAQVMLAVLHIFRTA